MPTNINDNTVNVNRCNRSCTFLYKTEPRHARLSM